MSRDTFHSMNFDALRLKVASPETIRKWSYGEVYKPETINYRTQKPEKGGLFAEEIFGPTKDWECYCGKYKKIRYKGIVCDKCGVEVTHSLVRRERMGHIELATPVSHIWFLRTIPSRVGLVLDLSIQSLEKVIYFASFIITHVDENEKKVVADALKKEYKVKKKEIEADFNKKSAGVEKSVLKDLEAERDRKMASLEEDFKDAEDELKDIEMLNIISEARYQNLSLRYGHLFESGIGAGAIRGLLERLDLPETIVRLETELKKSKGAKRERLMRRIKLLKSLHKNGIRPEWMIMTNIPVIPPDLRPMVALDGGRFATSDLNDLYRRVINRNNRLRRLLDLNAPEVICRNEKRMLQEAVDALIDNNARATKTVRASTGQKRQLRSLADILKGKQGRFRQNLLGKRVDYSGRSVIVVGPNLKISECGLPKMIALELFKPFIMSEIIKRELAHNVRSASRFIESNASEVWDILEELTKTTRVLLNRAPTLHRLGIQAFRPTLVEGKAIRLHPLVCAAFNADFDGDQMAVHLPLSEQAKWEAENLMASEKNLLKPATGSPVITPQQDIALGSYYLTRLDDMEGKEPKIFSSITEARYAYKTRVIKLRETIKVRFDNLDKFEVGTNKFIETSFGRILFNEILPDKIAYYNQTVTKKDLSNIIQFLLEFYGQEITAEHLDKIKNLGYKYATKSGYSLGKGDFPSIPGKKELLLEADKKVLLVEEQYSEGLLTDSERHGKVLEIWTETKDKLVGMGRDVMDQNKSVFAMIDSGARGSWGQLGQVISMKGLVASPSGDVIELPVKGNFKEGFGVLEFFISSHGTRKGLSDMALRTANAGYLTRRLVDVAQEVVVKEEDCGDTDGELFTLEQSKQMGEKLSERVLGRYVLADVKHGNKVVIKAGEVVTAEIARVIEKEEVDNMHVRSVLQCKLAKGVCTKCYGFDLSNRMPVKTGTAVGVIAAQSIGEPGTQLTMRTFHLGGVAGGGDITQGLPRVEELFEARNPKRKAILAEVAGKIEIEDADGKIITSPTGRKIFEGRRGQKIVKVHHEGSEEVVYEISKEDDVKIAEGQKVKKGDKILVRGGSGEIIKATNPGVVRFDGEKMVLTYDGKTTKEYVIPLGYKLWVNDGDDVEKGDQLTEGALDLKELFELKGQDAVKRYVLAEIQEIYASQGQRLNDKHIEIIIKQMFSRVFIEDPGETDLLPGEIVERSQLILANRQAKKDGVKEAKGRVMLMGISKISLTTQSFLSSASFQETSRVLVSAAITGKIDYLEGLKENVIIGRLISAGTGVSGIPELDEKHRVEALVETEVEEVTVVE